MAKIIKIKINTNAPVVEIGGREFVGVIITTQGFFGGIKIFEAYPSNRGIVRKKDDSLLYVQFVDEYGAFLDDEVSEQINNYLEVQKQLKAF